MVKYLPVSVCAVIFSYVVFVPLSKCKEYACVLEIFRL